MTQRWNNPPGWPDPPPGWMPPQGWKPPADWPQPPPGWQYYVDEAPPDPFYKGGPSDPWAAPTDPWQAPAEPPWATPQPAAQRIDHFAAASPAAHTARLKPPNSALMWLSWAGLPAYLVLLYLFSAPFAVLVGLVMTVLFANIDDRYLRQRFQGQANPPNGAWVLLFPPIYFYKRQRFTRQTLAPFWSWLTIFLVWFVAVTAVSIVETNQLVRDLQQSSWVGLNSAGQPVFIDETETTDFTDGVPTPISIIDSLNTCEDLAVEYDFWRVPPGLTLTGLTERADVYATYALTKAGQMGCSWAG